MKSLTSILFVLVLIFGSVSQAIACACCAEKGTWFRGAVTRTDAEMSLFEKWSGNVSEGALLTGNADIAEFGLFNPVPTSATFKIEGMSAVGRASVLFKDSNGKESGTIILNRNPRVRPIKTMSDVGDGKEFAGGGVSLYKEVVFTGFARGTGGLSKGIPPGTPYSLVIRGRGNGCHNDSDYSSWALRIGRATFFGNISFE
jgi:hypothetical protein